MTQNKMTRSKARKGKTARKQYRRLTTGAYSGQRTAFPVELLLLCEKDTKSVRLTHVTKHRFTDSTVRHKAHYIEVLEEEYEVENTDKDGNVTTRTKKRKVDGDYTYSTYSTAITQEA